MEPEDAYYRIHKSTQMIHILSQINPVHNTPSYFSKICYNIIITPTIFLPSGLFPFDFPTKILYLFHLSTCTRRVHHILFDSCNCNYNWWRVQVMKLFIMHFSLSSYSFIHLRCKYSPEHPVLKHPQSMCFAYCLLRLLHSNSLLMQCSSPIYPQPDNGKMARFLVA
jgi:hypothetical protein